MHIAVALLVIMSWGLNSAVSKIAVTNFPVFLFLSLRFFGTGLLFLYFSKLKKKDLMTYIKIALSFNVFHIGFICLSVYFLTASSSAVIQQMQIPMALLLSVIILKEKICSLQIAGMFIAIIGVVIMLGVPDVNFIGFIFTIISAFFFALTQIFLKTSGKVHLPTFVTWTSFFSVPFLLILSFFFDKKLIIENIYLPKFLLPLAYQIFVLGFSTAMWQKLVSTYGVNKMAPLALLSVVFAILGGMILLGEELMPKMAVGALTIISGVAMTVLFKPKEGFWKRTLNYIKSKF